jgi:hypothetical protein
MDGNGRPIVVVVRAGRRTETVLAWLRQLLPAAVLLVSPGTFMVTDDGAEGALVVDAEDVDSPMSLAAAVARAQAKQ